MAFSFFLLKTLTSTSNSIKSVSKRPTTGQRAFLSRIYHAATLRVIYLRVMAMIKKQDFALYALRGTAVDLQKYIQNIKNMFIKHRELK